MFTALPKERQIEAYDLLLRRSRDEYSYTESTDRYDFFSEELKGGGLSEYGFSILKNRKSLGVTLDGPPYVNNSRMRTVLVFATFNDVTGIGRTAALLAYDSKKRVVLLHNGNVFTRDGRGKPGIGKVVSVGDKEYYFVSYLDDTNFLRNLIRFHKSRKAPAPGEVAINRVKLRPGYDPGSDKGGQRKSVVFEARHHPITEALRDRLLGLKWKVSDVASFSPDLLVEKGGRKILFEVKPSGGSHGLMMGAAQLLVYNHFAGAKQLCLVAKSPASSPLGMAISEFLAENSLDFIKYRIEGDEVIFDDLSDVVG